MITPADAAAAATGDVYLEITSRRGHSLTNGHVQAVARAAGAKMLVNSDSHDPGDLLTPSFQKRVALGCGLPEAFLDEITIRNPQLLLERLERRRR